MSAETGMQEAYFIIIAILSLETEKLNLWRERKLPYLQDSSATSSLGASGNTCQTISDFQSTR